MRAIDSLRTTAPARLARAAIASATLVFAATIGFAVVACSAPRRAPGAEPWPAPLGQARDAHAIPSPEREFRAVWVATVANIDWPSRPGLSVAKQQDEARAILDRVESLGFNAVVFQVRPHADALYASRLEPWSSYLTGRQGRAPAPMYDPLEFWVAEAHARGLELHAWFNPYRANHPANRGGVHESSIVRSKPELVVRLGKRREGAGEFDGYWWMDPSLDAVQAHSRAVVLDVVDRYDIDGVHFDDYFYPYQSYNDGRDFPDDESYARYRAAGGELARNDWRRASVDRFIRELYQAIKARKPEVLFGISPFGIWRPRHPPSIRGLDQYDVLYADARKWIREGWVDYLTPQLYWPIAQEPQSFPVLLAWWMRQNPEGRHLWPGTTLRRSRSDEGATEILNQIQIVRGMLPDDPGICLFSMRSLMAKESRVSTSLASAKSPFARQALVPASPWISSRSPAAPRLAIDRANRMASNTTTEKGQGGPASIAISWQPGDKSRVARWVVYEERAGSWSYRILPGTQRKLRLRTVTQGDAARLTRVGLSAVSRSGFEGPRSVVDLTR